MATEIGKLTAVYEADVSKFEAGRKQVESGMKKTAQTAAQSTTHVKQAVDGLSRSLTTINSPLSGITAQVSNYSGLATGAAGATTMWATAIGALIGAAVAGTAAIYNMTVSVANATGKLKDLSQQTGFAVETLSALASAAETSGGSIETVTGALGIFERNMVEAQQQGTEMSRIFKQLSIDTDNNERALRQAIEQLRKMPAGAAQTALAMRLFGRSGREVLALIKEMDTDLDSFMVTLRAAGVLIGTDTANAGDKLSDSVREMHRQFEAVQRLVALEFGPTVLNTVQELTVLVRDNKQAVSDWASAFIDAGRGALMVADAVRTLGGQITGLGNIPIPMVLQMLGSVSGISGIFRGLQSLGAQPQTAGTAPTAGRPAFRTPNFSPFRPGALGGGGGGGGSRRRGGAGGRAGTDEGLQLLRQLERELESLAPKRIMWERLQGEEYKKTSDAIKKKIYILDIEIDRQKKVNELTRERIVTGIEEREEFQKFVDLVQQSLTRPRRVADLMIKGGGDDNFATGVGKVDRSAELREQYEAHVERMRSLAFDLTNALDRAIYEGFESGIKRGFQSLTLSILSMVQNVFLRQIENALANALSRAGGGGGWLSALLGIGIGAVAGAFGGGFTKGGSTGGFAGKHQYGGMIGMGQWGIVHQNERVMATPYGALVTPSSGGGGSNTVININVPVRSAGTYSSPKSRRQLAVDISAALQGSLA